MTYFAKKQWMCVFKQLFWSAVMIGILLLLKKWLPFKKLDEESFLFIIGLFFVNIVNLFVVLRPSLEKSREIFTIAFTNSIAVFLFNLLAIFFFSPGGFVGSPYFFCILLLMSLFVYIFKNMIWPYRERSMNSSILQTGIQTVVTIVAMIFLFSLL